MVKKILKLLLLMNKYLAVFEKALLCILLFILVFLSFGQIVSRNLFSIGFVWVDQAIRICVLLLAFTGASLASEYNRHIKIDLLYNIINSRKLKKIIELVAQVSAMMICLLLFTSSAEYVNVVSSDSRSSIIPSIPDWYFRMVIPYCFFVMVIRHFTNILKLSGEEKPA